MRENISMTVEHQGLGKYKIVRGENLEQVKAEAEALAAAWDAEWELECEKRKQREEEARKNKEIGDKYFNLLLEERALANLCEEYLSSSLQINYSLPKKEGPFLQYNKTFSLPNFIEKPTKRTLFDKPEKGNLSTNETLTLEKMSNSAQKWLISCIITNAFLFIPALLVFFTFHIGAYLAFLFGFSPFIIFSIFSYSKYKRIKQQILEEKENIAQKNKEIEEQWIRACQFVEQKNKEIREEVLSAWKKDKEVFFADQQAERDFFNSSIDSYEHGEEQGIEFFVLELLKLLPESDKLKKKCCLKESQVQYNADSKMLLLDYAFPTLEIFQTFPKDIKILSSGEIRPVSYSEREIKRRYDSFIYQMIFSVLHVVFVGDIKKHIHGIVINGYVSGIDRSIGKPCTNCIVSLQISREDFEQLDLAEIDPKQCFEKLRGLAVVPLDTQTPVAPILKINKEDRRFVESYEVSQGIDAGTNLASMDWQDFENLIRELFERYFSKNGGECKVTQASRDGGVDAIAFDPDPIRGGKIVIQAKRYTNVVGVSAVRDLYGTILNEGANKGILVTTSDFGTDAHKFANGKPITLINGSNLLHLLQEEMGKKAYISLSEAKKVLKNQ